MSEIVLFGIVGLCWIGLCVRLWDLSRKSDNRALAWICFGIAALASSTTLQITAVAALVDARSVMDTAGTLSNCLTLISLTCFQCSFQHMIHPGADAMRRIRPLLWWCASVVVAVVVLFALFGSNYPDVLATRNSEEQVPVISVAGYLYLVHFAVSAVLLTVSSWAYARITARFSLRVGMALMGTGLLIGLAYSLVRLTSMATYQLGLHIKVLHGDLIGDLFRAAIIVDLVGIVFPFIGPRVGLDSLMNRWRVNRSLHTLHPLWNALRKAFPAIVLDAPDVTPERVLHRRIIEIWDGRLQLRPWFDPAAAERAGKRGDAAVEATLIADALSRRADGVPPANLAAALRPITAKDDVAWLSLVSKEFGDVYGAP